MYIDNTELANFIASTISCEALDFEETLRDALDYLRLNAYLHCGHTGNMGRERELY